MKRYNIQNCTNKVYHLNEKGELCIKHKINVSTYMPQIIKNLINKIHNRYNYHYIICPFYNKHYDYQIGITETSKMGETDYDTIIRGINEECGLTNIIWDENDINEHIDSKRWLGVKLSNNDYSYEPKKIINNNEDDVDNKVGIIIHNKIQNLLKTFENIKFGDINTDNICGLGFISVYDCKYIINNN